MIHWHNFDEFFSRKKTKNTFSENKFEAERRGVNQIFTFLAEVHFSLLIVAAFDVILLPIAGPAAPPRPTATLLFLFSVHNINARKAKHSCRLD